MGHSGPFLLYFKRCDAWHEFQEPPGRDGRQPFSQPFCPQLLSLREGSTPDVLYVVHPWGEGLSAPQKQVYTIGSA